MNVIKIDVQGPTGVGKSHVLTVIKRALEAEYGLHTQVASYDLSMELALVKEDQMSHPHPSKTIFVLTETNERTPAVTSTAPGGGSVSG